MLSPQSPFEKVLVSEKVLMRRSRVEIREMWDGRCGTDGMVHFDVAGGVEG